MHFIKVLWGESKGKILLRDNEHGESERKKARKEIMIIILFLIFLKS